MDKFNKQEQDAILQAKANRTLADFAAVLPTTGTCKNAKRLYQS